MIRKKVILIITVIATATAIFSLYMIISTLYKGEQEQKAFDELTILVEGIDGKSGKQNAQEDKPSPIIMPIVTETEDETSSEHMILSEYAAVYEKNHDFFGWIRIDDTQVNYPVMHTPADPQYYLHRAFDKSETKSGTPFLDGACYEGCGNYIIYGHHMKNGTMFQSITKYADKAYWEAHRSIYFDTLHEHGEYEVIAAFYGKALAKDEPGFRYYQYTDLTDSEVFNEYISQAKSASAYDTGVTAEYGDELITLSTCSYHTDDGRFVVVARRIRD